MNQRLKQTALALWIVNLIVFCAVMLIAGLRFSASAAPLPALSPTTAPGVLRNPLPTATRLPAVTLRPSLTPWPTPSLGPSLTPFAAQSPNRLVIGFSVENRPLEVYRFGAGASVKLIVAGIHGGYEHNTVELAAALIGYLNDNPQTVPPDTSLYILQNLNPDGYARKLGVEGRANANNVDLNRNWPYNWKKDWARDGCWLYTPIEGGQTEASEPEVQALIAFIDQIRPQALISYHSAALGIFPGGRPDYPPSIRLAQAIADVTDYPYPPIDTGCDYTGNLTDWAANTRGIPAVDIELTNHRDTDFQVNLRVLQIFLDWKP